MIAVLHLDVIEILLNPKNLSTHKEIFDIFYNNNIEIYFTEKYIELLEKKVSDIYSFQPLMVELNDKSRIRADKVNSKPTLDEEFIDIAVNSRYPCVIPVVYNDTKNFILKAPFLLVINEALPINKHWIKMKILCNNICNVCYQNFKTDSEIIDFFENVFKLPKYITEIHIFDREPIFIYAPLIKGCHIKYFTFLPGGTVNEHKRKSFKKDLISNFGGKTKLFYTNTRRNLHERKILFEDIIITVDNSHQNLTVKEPTWEIFVTYDKEKSKNWISKKDKFVEVR